MRTEYIFNAFRLWVIILFGLFSLPQAWAQKNLQPSWREKELISEFQYNLKWAKQSENPEPMRKLGDAYNYGYGVAQNNNEAIKWYLRAIKQGDSLARSNLSMLYLSNGRKHSAGEGVPQDYTKALSWYRKSADLDNSAADIAIGEIFEHGKGVPRNLKSARLWYNRAVRDGREYALSALERVDPLAAAKAEAKFTDFDHDGIYPSGVPCARLGKEVDNFLACIEAAGKKVEIWANDGDLPRLSRS